MKEKKNFPGKWILVCIAIAITAFSIGFFAGEKVYCWVITPFRNTEGIFDYGIFWTACGALSTFVVSVIAIWQSSKANDISKDLMELENNNSRPYIRLSIGAEYHVNKGAFAFNEKILELSRNSKMWFEGTVVLKGHENNPNCFWPTAEKFFFIAQNIGGSSISSIRINRLLVLNCGTGVVKRFLSSMDTSLFVNEKKEFFIDVKEQVPIIDGQPYNPISEEYRKLLALPIRHIQIELGLEYDDIYGRTFYQEYSVYLSFSLQTENETEYTFLVEEPSIRHYAGKSPYGPRGDE